jgi:hypothetical protein
MNFLNQVIYEGVITAINEKENSVKVNEEGIKVYFPSGFPFPVKKGLQIRIVGRLEKVRNSICIKSEHVEFKLKGVNYGN